jgi:hypothetical protein
VTGLLTRFFAPRREPVQELNHPTLGTLVYDRESRKWGKTATLSGRPFRLSVGGDYEPDPGLLDTASKVEAGSSGLAAALQAFLAHEAAETPEFAGEIRSLAVADVGIWWPKQPDAAMIWFDGPSPERIWHCDYKNGVLSGLVSDQ